MADVLGLEIASCSIQSIEPLVLSTASLSATWRHFNSVLFVQTTLPRAPLIAPNVYLIISVSSMKQLTNIQNRSIRWFPGPKTFWWRSSIRLRFRW